MANEVNENEKLDESIGDISFGSSQSGSKVGPYFYPTGRLGQFIAKYFATKAQPYVAKQTHPSPTPQAALAGDTVQMTDVVRAEDKSAVGAHSKRELYLPELEKNRKERYKQFEEMDDYPEIGAAFDIYADECTQKNLQNKRWMITGGTQTMIDDVYALFDVIQLSRSYWDILRNIVKYGDCFIETILDVDNPKKGLQRIKVLNPNFVIRVENEYGYLTDFLQEIPRKDDWGAFGGSSRTMTGSKFITLDRNQIVHFRLRTSDPAYYPYGKSIGALGVRIFRSLKLMEDAMLIYRLSRAPERRIFYIDIANMPAAKAEAFMERVKDKFKKEKYYDPSKGNIDSRYNPLSADEDFFVPTRNGAGTKIETLPGAQNLGDVDDVKYFRDKLLACLKIPKDYIVEKDKSPERKANLSQLDVKFARVIGRVQQQAEIGLEQIARRHLALMGYPVGAIKSLQIILPEASDISIKRKLEIDEAKTRTVQAILGTELFPKKTIYKEFYDMNDQQIEEVMLDMEEEQAQAAEKEQEKAMDQAQLDQQGADQDSEREEGEKSADFSRDQSAASAEHSRNKELAQKQQKESVNNRLIETLLKVKSKMLARGEIAESKIKSINRTISKIQENLTEDK